MLFRTAALSALVSTQSLSSSCTTSLAQIATDSDAAACLSPSSLIQLISGTNTSVIEPLNNWVTNICASAPCTNNTIAEIVTNVTTGCAILELSGTGLSPPGLTANLVDIIQQYYSTIRQILCFTDSNVNCVTQTLTNMQNVIGTLTVNTLIPLILGVSPNSLPANVTCTNCAKASYIVLTQTAPPLVSDTVPLLQSKCGTSFTDGNMPPSVIQSASNITLAPMSSSSAVRLDFAGFQGNSLHIPVAIAIVLTASAALLL